MSEIEKFNLVYVKWIDSYGCGSVWEPISEVNPVPHYCHSIGWNVKENNEVIVLVPHLSMLNEKIGSVDSGCGDMTIPIVSIVERTIIRCLEKTTM